MKVVLAILGVILVVIGVLVVLSLTHGLATAGAIVGILCLWGLGFRNIKIAHLGQPTLFGMRLRWHFNEGSCWVFPLIMGMEEIDARIGEKTFETPFIFSKDKVRVSFTVAYWLKTVKPYLLLGTKKEEIFEGIEDIIETSARLFVKDHNEEACRQASEELVQKLGKEVQEACQKWGIEITKLVITDVNYTQQYEDDLEAEKSREHRVRGDEREIESLIGRAQKTKKELKLSSDEKAVEIDQLQTGKVKKEIKKIDVGENLKDMLPGLIEKLWRKH